MCFLNLTYWQSVATFQKLVLLKVFVITSSNFRSKELKLVMTAVVLERAGS